MYFVLIIIVERKYQGCSDDSVVKKEYCRVLVSLEKLQQQQMLRGAACLVPSCPTSLDPK